MTPPHQQAAASGPAAGTLVRPRPADPSRRRIAVVGAGVSGLTAAYVLRRQARVTLYEAAHRLGGHAHTHQLSEADGVPFGVDSGFIVHNDRTYPLLRKLFDELGVPTQPTEMSMSIWHQRTGLQYAGGKGFGGILAQPGRLVSPPFLRMLGHVVRFHRLAARHLAAVDPMSSDLSYADFLALHRFPRSFVELYAVPVVSCVWSCAAEAALEYPAAFLFRFLDHHGMLSIGDSPRWRTIPGGSASYVQRLAARLDDVRSGSKVTQIRRMPSGSGAGPGDAGTGAGGGGAGGGVEITDGNGQLERFDAVVIATHADEAISLLADPTPLEQRVLGAFSYSTNHTVLHTDASLLPGARRAKASWNFLIPRDAAPGAAPVVTYWMNKLQRLQASRQYLVTLNGRERVRDSSVLAEMEYRHPLYDNASHQARRRLPELASERTVFAGAYHGWGFHEDGCRSGVQAAERLGVPW
ncbi:NAD(P)/FAD-dependent oxidoreductase [Nakamurella aerolata]|uniref:NAD(P)-binding protein n=1 Tax=Nakamurella aerolata TaxID=1656892 RepID=A0A849A3P0_9ACTN|nr:FAD-dependent oxidoreductase [Nakamurella aerolata]NNG35644.1 NAD(P)-binding protein [Nakamurella aerolata]